MRGLVECAVKIVAWGLQTLVLFGFLSFDVCAEESTNLLEASARLPRGEIRNGAPTPVSVHLQWHGSGVQTGRLRYTVRELNPKSKTLLRIESDEIAFDNVPREIWATIPEITGNEPGLYVEFHHLESGRTHSILTAHPMYKSQGTTKFAAETRHLPDKESRENNTQNVASTILMKDARWRGLPKSVSLGICAPSVEEIATGLITKGTGELRGYWKGFVAEVLSPPYFWETEIMLPETKPVWIPAKKMPTNAIAFECYDAVLFQDGVEFLGVRQTQALGHWIRSGGRAVIRASENEQQEVEQWLRSIGGRMVTTESRSDRAEVLRFSIELGRVLLLPPKFEVPRVVDTDLTRAMSSAIRETMRDGEKKPLPFFADHHVEHMQWFWAASDLAKLGIPYFGEGVQRSLIEKLTPRGRDAIPLRAIVIVAVLCLIAATPVDFVLFGFLRKRVLTWIAFPVVVLCSTGFIVHQANERAPSDTSGSWDVVVLGKEDKVLRKTTFELYVPPSHGEFKLAMKNATLHEIGHRLTPELAAGIKDRNPFKPIQDYFWDDAPHWTFVGNYPTRYEARRPVAQWSSVIVRTEQIAPNINVPRFRWNERDVWPRPGAQPYPNFVSRYREKAEEVLDQRVNIATAQSGPDEFQSFPLWRESPLIPGWFSYDTAVMAVTIEKGNRFITYVRLLRRADMEETRELGE